MSQKYRSYEVAGQWRDYQPFFPERARLTAGDEPKEEWWRWEGIDVHLDRYPGAGPAKVFVVHGAGGYSRLLAPLAVSVNSEGYEVLAPDMPGYGLTEVAPSRNKWSLWVELLAALVDAELARDPRPIVLFGASIGGPLAFHAAGLNPRVAGLIATMLLDPREKEARAVLAAPWMPSLLTGFVDHAPRPLDRLRVPIRAVSNMTAIANDPEIVRLLTRDPCGAGNWVPLGFLRTFMTAAPPVAPEDFGACPVLVVHPARDRWTPVEHTRRLLSRLSAPCELVMLENCGHLPLEEPGISQLDDAVKRFLASVTAGRPHER